MRNCDEQHRLNSRQRRLIDHIGQKFHFNLAPPPTALEDITGAAKFVSLTDFIEQSGWQYSDVDIVDRCEIKHLDAENFWRYIGESETPLEEPGHLSPVTVAKVIEYGMGLLGCFIEGYVSSDQALAKEADFGKLTRGALEFARGTFVTCSEEHNWYEHFQLLNAASRNSCWGTDRRMASLPASRGSLHYLVRLKKLTNGHQTMDKVADFYNRWFATRRIPDYSGVQAASEELAKQLLGVYESNKRDFWQSCAVKFLCGTLLHLCTQAHLYGKERMTLREVIAFIEAEPIEKSWKELMASQATDESITRIMAGAGELMLESPPPVARAILVTVFSRLSEEARAA